MYACTSRNLKALCAHQHPIKHYQASNPYEYISFCELCPEQAEFPLYKTGLIHE